MPSVKFCGLTRASDAAVAVTLGARYVGVIFAGGPRQVTPEAAREILAPVRGTGVRAVGVFGAMDPSAIALAARDATLDVVQLHADPDATLVEAVRDRTGLEIWAAVRCTTALPASAGALFDSADAVLLDAKADSGLGGTGRSFDWTAIAPQVAAVRGSTTLVLAGGLRPDTVATAVAALSPDIVDVSSGVEITPGVKDHDRMRAFMNALSPAAFG